MILDTFILDKSKETLYKNFQRALGNSSLIAHCVFERKLHGTKHDVHIARLTAITGVNEVTKYVAYYTIGRKRKASNHVVQFIPEMYGYDLLVKICRDENF